MPAGRDQIKPMQRLVRIMAVLDQAGTVGATRDQLIAVAAYGDADPGSQLALDLKHLRHQGWQIDNIAAAGETARYRMVSGDNRLRLRLSPRQLAALQRAVILAERSDLATSLGVPAGSLPDGIGASDVGTSVVPGEERAQLSHALEAVRLKSRISFTYKGSRRTVDPGTVRFQDYQWYLSGIEAGAAEDAVVKHFVVGRMSDSALDKPGTAGPVPSISRIPLHPLGWEIDEPTRVVLRVPADYVSDVERWLQAPEAARSGEGWVEMVYTVTNRAAFRARIYMLGTRVSVVSPEELRAEIVAELGTLAGR